jgi:hypothetical protein
MAGHTRLVFHTDSMKTADVHTFKSAAITVAKAYKTKYPRDSVRVGFVRSGKDIVQQINSIGVGHVTNSSPDKNPNGNASDYRYGKVRVYKNGNLIKDNVERWGSTFENSSTPKK